MKMKDLEALGFIAVAGCIDRNGVNYGVLTAHGPVLTPEGEELVAALNTVEQDAPSAIPAAPKAVKPKAVKAVTPELKAPDTPDDDPLAGLNLDE